MFDRGPSPSRCCCCCWRCPRRLAKTEREAGGGQRANTRQMWQAVEIRTYPLTLVLEQLILFSPLPREFPQPWRSPPTPPPPPPPLLLTLLHPFLCCLQRLRLRRGNSGLYCVSRFCLRCPSTFRMFHSENMNQFPLSDSCLLSFIFTEQTHAYFLCQSSWSWQEDNASRSLCFLLSFFLADRSVFFFLSCLFNLCMYWIKKLLL